MLQVVPHDLMLQELPHPLILKELEARIFCASIYASLTSETTTFNTLPQVTPHPSSETPTLHILIHDEAQIEAQTIRDSNFSPCDTNYVSHTPGHPLS